DVRVFALDRLATMRPAPLPPTTWWLTGQGAKPRANAPTTAGKQAFLTADSPKAAPAAQGKIGDAPSPVLPFPAAPVHAATPLLPAPALPANGDLVAAYTAYQETMRAYLALQEQVMSQLLGAPRAAGVA